MSTAMDVVVPDEEKSSVDEMQTLLNDLVLRLFETMLAVRDDNSDDIRSSLGDASVHSEKILQVYRSMMHKIDLLPGIDKSKDDLMQEISSKVEELKAANSRVKVLEKDLRGLQQHVQGELMKNLSNEQLGLEDF